MPWALLDPGLSQIDVNVLAFAGALLPDRGLGDCVGCQNGRGRRSSLYDRLADGFLASKGYLTAAIVNGEACVPEDIVGNLSQVIVVIDWLMSNHAVLRF